MMSLLNPEKALIFRIMHLENLPWLLTHGLRARSSVALDPSYREIGNPDLIKKRSQRKVPIPPGGTLDDYIPFYFTPASPMLFNIKTGYAGMRRAPMEDIVILVSSLRELARAGIPFLFTDRHAYLSAAEFFSDLQHLERIDWAILQNRDFKRDPDDPAKFERYQAEALVHLSLPVTALAGIVCHGPDQKARIQAMVQKVGIPLRIVVKADWYFT